MRHFGEHEGEPCLMLGYNGSQGNILLVHLDDIADGAEMDTMINFLQRYRNDNRNIAAIIAQSNEPFMGYPSMTAYFSGKRGHDGSATALRQIPEFYVKMYDRQQSESWTGSSARYTNQVKPHRFLERYQGASGEPVTTALPEIPQTVQTNESETVATGSDAIEFLKSRGLPIPPELQEAGIVETAVEETVAPVETATSGYVETVEPVAEPAAPVNTPMRNDNQVVDLLQQIADQIAEQNGNFKRVFKRMDEVDTSIRSAARNLEKAGFEKPETPPTPAQRKKAKSETSN